MDRLSLDGRKPVVKKKIPMAKPFFSEKTINDIASVLKSGYLIQGSKVAQFEEEFKDKVGAEFAYAVNSGTTALHISYMSLLNSEDEVIVPNFTFISTVSMVVFSGGKPIFADIDKDTLTIDIEDIKEKLTSKTKIIAPVHLFGNAADMDALSDIAEDHHLYLVNDAAQAHGTRFNGRDVGSLDDLNCFSFYATKIMTTGEGGLVTTNNEKLYNMGRLIRNHGQLKRYHHKILGFNSRMTEIAAVLGLNQLKMIDYFLQKRKQNAKVLTEELRRITGLKPQKVGIGVDHSYSYYTVIMDLDKFRCNRNQFVEALKAENIESLIYYPIPLTKQPALKKFVKNAYCPISEKLSNEVFSIPVHPSLTDEDLKLIVKAINKVATHYSK